MAESQTAVGARPAKTPEELVERWYAEAQAEAGGNRMRALQTVQGKVLNYAAVGRSGATMGQRMTLEALAPALRELRRRLGIR